MAWGFHFLDEDVRAAVKALDAYQLADLKMARDILTGTPVTLLRALGKHAA